MAGPGLRCRATGELTYGSESFCYDGLNRLVADKLASSIDCASDAYKHVVSYNAILGSSPRTNILTKTRLDDNSLANIPGSR